MENDENDALKLRYLKNAIPRFKKCKSDLSQRSDTAFHTTLSDEEIQILGSLMFLEYLKPQITSLENIKQSISNKDFVLTSQASFLESLMKLRKDVKDETNKLIVDYTYNNGNLDRLR
ncbi:hypothetical protein D3C78_1054850 [compost metagenome]